MSLCCVVLYMNLVRRLLNEATNTTQNTVDRIVDTTTCCYERKTRFYFSITLGLLQNFMVMHKFYFRVLFFENQLLFLFVALFALHNVEATTKVDYYCIHC